MSVSPDTLVRQLQWRYATKKFDSTRKIPSSDWAALEDALVLTPSSFGLQPWKFIVITNQAVKDQLVAASWGQKQVAEASHVVVFAIKTKMGPAEVDQHLQRIATVQGRSPESLNGLRDMIVGFLAQPAEKFNLRHWAMLQTYIAIGNFMTSAALMGIDTCPMEGFVPAQYDAILNLAEQGLTTSVVCVAGYRANDDKYAHAPKVRFPASEVIARIP